MVAASYIEKIAERCCTGNLERFVPNATGRTVRTDTHLALVD